MNNAKTGKTMTAPKPKLYGIRAPVKTAKSTSPLKSRVPAKETGTQTELVQLPDPAGHYMLIALPNIEEMTKNGILIPDVVSERERTASVVGTVVAQGDSCYKDKQRFPEGPWCKTGDTVMFSRYKGMRFVSKNDGSSYGIEYRMLEDDQIVGTVPTGAEVGGI